MQATRLSHAGLKHARFQERKHASTGCCYITPVSCAVWRSVKPYVHLQPAYRPLQQPCTARPFWLCASLALFGMTTTSHPLPRPTCAGADNSSKSSSSGTAHSSTDQDAADAEPSPASHPGMKELLVRAQHALDAPDVLTMFVGEMRKQAEELQATAVTLVAPKSAVSFPQVRMDHMELLMHVCCAAVSCAVLCFVYLHRASL